MRNEGILDPPPEEEGKQGPDRPRGQPRSELILPSGAVGFIDTAAELFPRMAKEYLYFVRVRAIVEITFGKRLKDNGIHDVFQLLEPDSLRSRIEYIFETKAWRREKDGRSTLKPTRCSHDAAKVLLNTKEAFKLLPHVSTLAAAPVIAGEKGRLKILSKGHHDIHNGIYVVNGGKIPIPSLEEAVETLLEIYADYDFVTAGPVQLLDYYAD